MNLDLLVDAVKILFQGHKTRSQRCYSPCVIKTDIPLEGLVYNAMDNEQDPLGSPLTTPPSSRPSSPQPDGFSADILDLTLDSSVPLQNNSLVDAVSTQSGPEVQGVNQRKPRWKRGITEVSSPASREGGGVQVDSGRKKARTAEEIANSKQRSKKNRRKKKDSHQKQKFSQDPESLKEIAQDLGSRHFNRAKETTACVTLERLEKSVSTPGYIGKRTPLPESRSYRLEDLVNDGTHNFKLVKSMNETQHISCPDTKKIMALVVPSPWNDPTWQDSIEKAGKTIKALRQECTFESIRRGDFNSGNYGISLGGGQPRPMVLSNQGATLKRVLEKIRQDPHFCRIAGFMSTTFLMWAPQLFFFYAITTSALLDEYSNLYLPFANAVFAAFTVNFGPRTVCYPHRDSKNLAFGWCAITALGDFDFRKGGHLVLWDLKMVVEFPPGYTIYIPSALICHFNTAIGLHEERYSFTMYSAGGLFRWVEHGFQAETIYETTADALSNAELDRTRWKRGLELLSTFEGLQADL